MKYPKMFLVGLIFSALSYGGEQKSKWIGLEKYWYREHSASMGSWRTRGACVYKYCSARNNNQYCAKINAYLLLQAAERDHIQQLIQNYEKSISSITQEIEVKEAMLNGEIDFVDKMELEKKLYKLKQKRREFIRDKADKEKEKLYIDAQIKMGNLSDNLNSKDAVAQLENAFNSIVRDEDRADEIKYLIAARSNALRKEEEV